jgi:hypothetical protein
VKNPVSVFLLLLLCHSALAREKREPNPNLVNIHKVFIKGNSEVAALARKRELTPREQRVNGLCFGLVGSEAPADATLEISQDTASDGTVAASGNLTDRQGNLLWSDSKEERAGVIGGEVIITAAENASNFLMQAFEDGMCGVPPLIELNRVRKIYVAPDDRPKGMTLRSSCITFVERTIDADALLEFGGRFARKGGPTRVLFDPKNNDEIPGWETGSFPSVADLERALGCPITAPEVMRAAPDLHSIRKVILETDFSGEDRARRTVEKHTCLQVVDTLAAADARLSWSAGFGGANLKLLDIQGNLIWSKRGITPPFGALNNALGCQR